MGPPGNHVTTRVSGSSKKIRPKSYKLQQENLTCLNNSMGGWAPYFSLDGMLRSSTNTTHFLPGGGPYTPLRRLLRNNIVSFYTVNCKMPKVPSWSNSLKMLFQLASLEERIRVAKRKCLCLYSEGTGINLYTSIAY